VIGIFPDCHIKKEEKIPSRLNPKNPGGRRYFDPSEEKAATVWEASAIR